MGISTRGC
jgi:GTP-binding protein